MNKSELVSAMSSNSGLTKTDCEKALSAFMSAVKDALANKEDIRLVGFGTFTVTERKAHEGRNPKTGETIQVPACTIPKFKPGKDLKDFIKSC